MSQSEYDPIQYWKEKGKTYYQDFKYNDDYNMQEYQLIEYLKSIEFKSVLEFGCGFGRITNLIQNILKPAFYSAVDVSSEQLDHIRYVDETIQADIEHFNLDRKYDLVIAVEVLMHQLPSKIQIIIDKMISLSKKHVINVDYYWQGEQLEPHNFNHNYPQLYRYKAEMLRIGKQGLFHYVV